MSLTVSRAGSSLGSLEARARSPTAVLVLQLDSGDARAGRDRAAVWPPGGLRGPVRLFLNGINVLLNVG